MLIEKVHENFDFLLNIGFKIVESSYEGRVIILSCGELYLR